MCNRTKTKSRFDPSGKEKMFLNSKNVDLNNLNEDEIEWIQSQRLYHTLGQGGLWQMMWCFLLCLFQSDSTFHIFTFVFQVSLFLQKEKKNFIITL